MQTARISAQLFGFCAAACVAVFPAAYSASAPAAPPKKSGATGGGAASSVRPTLAGIVVGPRGKPVGGANVYLYTAAPIKGTSPFCPSCYPDCQKHAVTDGQGRFRITDLDPNLRFRVLVVANGFAPTFPPSVVPRNGAVRLVLPPPRAKTTDTRRLFRGTVVGPDGSAVVGAKIEPYGVKMGEMITYGSVDGVDSLGVTNEKGEFELLCDDPEAATARMFTRRKQLGIVDSSTAAPETQVLLLISARGLASQTTPFLPTGSVRHVFKMETGATVRGRVKNTNGAPFRPVAVGIVQVDKRCETFVGHTDIGTDKNGQFTLTNITPNQDYVLYGTMDTFGTAASKPLFLPLQKIHVGASGSTTDLGTLSVRPAHRVSGRVVLPGNRRIPPQTRLLISRDAAWDSRLVVLDKNGAFETNDLPAETVSLYLNLPGFHIAPSTKGYEKNQQAVVVSAEKGDTKGLQILMEPDKAK